MLSDATAFDVLMRTALATLLADENPKERRRKLQKMRRLLLIQDSLSRVTVLRQTGPTLSQDDIARALAWLDRQEATILRLADR